VHSPIAVQRNAINSPLIRVMLIDDSLVVRSIFARLIAQSGQAEVVAEADNCERALELLRTTPVDIILLDIEMPHRTGLDALPEILDAAGGARVIVVSSFVEENGAAAIRALSLGACDTLAKPGRTGFAGRFPDMLVDKVVRLGQPDRLAVQPKTCSTSPVEGTAATASRPDCMVIGGSTGAIPVIFEIIRGLPDRLDCPVFIAQHLPEAFMGYFAEQLQRETARRVCIPHAPEPVAASTIYVSPGAGHLVTRRQAGRIYADRICGYAHSHYSPSVDALFESVAGCYGGGALAIMLSGMGNDGLRGARKLAQSGASIIVQDERSSVIWGMPGAIARSGIANLICPPAGLIRHLAQLAS